MSVFDTTLPQQAKGPTVKDFFISYVNIFEPGEIVGYHRRNPDIVAIEAALSEMQHS